MEATTISWRRWLERQPAGPVHRSARGEDARSEADSGRSARSVLKPEQCARYVDPRSHLRLAAGTNDQEVPAHCLAPTSHTPVRTCPLPYLPRTDLR